MHHRLDTFGRWIWAAICFALCVVALVQGGLGLLSLVLGAILAYAFLFAICATVATIVRRIGAGAAPPVWVRFATNFRKALVDGPLFLLAFW